MKDFSLSLDYGHMLKICLKCSIKYIIADEICAIEIASSQLEICIIYEKKLALGIFPKVCGIRLSEKSIVLIEISCLPEVYFTGKLRVV